MKDVKNRVLVAITFCCLFAMVAVTGCASMNDVQKDRTEGKGTTKNYAVSAEQAYDISKTVFRWHDVDAIEEHKDKLYMFATVGVSLMSYGSLMGAWIEPDGDNNSNVTSVIRSKAILDYGRALIGHTETQYHKDFAKAVAIMKSGQPLPDKRPQE